MNIKIHNIIIGLLFLGIISSVSAAEELVVVEVRKVSIDEVYQMVKSLAESDRKALVNKNLKMTDEESKKFWPIYTAYRKDVNLIQTQQFKLIKEFAANYSSLTDEKAGKLLNEHLGTKRSLLKLRKKYLSDFRKSVPAIKVAKFYQVENKLNAIVNVRLAEEIPLAK